MGGFIERIKGLFSMEDDDYQYLEGNGDEEAPRRPTLIPISSRKTEILILQPSSYQDALQAAEHLKRKRILVLNLEKTDYNLTGKIIEFLRGVNYSQEGHMENVTDNIFLFTPNNIGIKNAGRKESRNLFAKPEGGSKNEWETNP